MGKDTKLTHIELKVPFEEISTSKRKLAAERIQEHWPEIDDFQAYAEEYPQGEEADNGVENPSGSLYRDVYAEYFGPVDDERTVLEIRREFNSVTDYIEAKEHGLDSESSDPEADFEKIQEAYRKGYRDAVEDLKD